MRLTKWGKWYLDTTNVHGFRLDAVKHIARDFFPEWLGKLREETHKELFAVGEYWNSEIDILMNYLKECKSCMSLFDVPLHFHFFEASNSGGEFDMRELLKDTLVSKAPCNAVTFVDNHDTQAGQALESAIQPWFVPLAYAVILLRPQGYPCVFYGNYYGVEAMNGPSFKKEIDLMMDLPRGQGVQGVQHDYLSDPDVVGWTMEGDEAPGGDGLAVCDDQQAGRQPKSNAGRRNILSEIWTDCYGRPEGRSRDR